MLHLGGEKTAAGDALSIVGSAETGGIVLCRADFCLVRTLCPAFAFRPQQPAFFFIFWEGKIKKKVVNLEYCLFLLVS